MILECRILKVKCNQQTLKRGKLYVLRNGYIVFKKKVFDPQNQVFDFSEIDANEMTNFEDIQKTEYTGWRT